MCGIAGIYVKDNQAFEKKVLFKNVSLMLQTILHRGPDENGIQVIGKDKCIGNCRLSIVDQFNGHQPMFSEDKRTHIVFNGEIYNYRDIKGNLSSRHSFKTNTDTELILHAYEKYGARAFEKFNGMFAVCIIDGDKMILARDRLGVKPLYYRIDNNKLAFASEIKALIQKNDSIFFEDAYKAFETTIGENTLINEIKQIPPGSYLIFNGKTVTIKRYWNLLDSIHTSENFSLKKSIEYFRYLLMDAVEIRKPANLPLGVTLSGGIDSSLIACLVKPEFLFSSIVKGDMMDEEKYVDLIGKNLNTPIIKVYPDINDFKKVFPKMMWHLDEPVTTLAAYPMYLLSQEMKKYVKVVLNGQGADELLGGYARHLMIYMDYLLKESPQLSGYQSLKKHFWNNAFDDALSKRYFHLTQRGLKSSKVLEELFEEVFTTFIDRPISAAGYMDLLTTFPPLLRADDRMCMAFGIEARSPFLDYRIVEFAFSIPDEAKIRFNHSTKFTTKYILREAFKDILPKEIVLRTEKVGYPSPVAGWLNSDLKSFMNFVHKQFDNITEFKDLNFSQKNTRGNFDRSKWQMMQLFVWHQLFIKKEPIDSLSLLLNLHNE